MRPVDVEIVDLFAGPGGLDVAARELGRSVTGIEWDANACATRRAAGLSTIEGDVRNYHPSDFPNATVLAGGPPCQTYTVAGTGAGRRALDDVLRFVARMARNIDVTKGLADLDDERTGLVLEPLRWALAAMHSGHPYEAIVLEQVPSVLPVWKAFGMVLESKGYSVDSGVLHTEEFGVPQTRRRAVLIARLHGDAELPGTTHQRYRKGQPPTTGTQGPKPWVSMGEALARTRSEPFVVISNYGTGGDPKDRGRRSSHEPAATVTGKVSRNRVVALDGTERDRFSFAEAGLLQTFPANHPWTGNAVAQQIGNAIPPLLATHVLKAALDLDGASSPRPARSQQALPLFDEVIRRDRSSVVNIGTGLPGHARRYEKETSRS
ncbi:DNA cytosine methyltransferase [Streptomyces sp. NPDC059568]|uniref:DNA cytosine methyltransferase n=1 Tax=Streptomyces sp. NPDC059568 TaxID=3346868 RepID=UPI0036C97ACA